MHHGMLQYALKTLDVPPTVTPNNMASLIDSMTTPKAQITFSQDELPSHEVQHQYGPLMIIVLINGNAVI